jgi:prepilin-type N-terminal cleavage/methylation domain-containing protein/prepilin-type processing-associated H-X9-DG protein
MSPWWLVVLLLGALRALGLLRWRVEQLEATTPSRGGRGGLKPGQKAPDFTLPSVAGGEVSLHDFASRVFLVFTQNRCKPCHRIVPEFSRRGSTLLELVVVVAILGVLLALVLPAVQKVRAAAGRLACASNLRQIGLGLHHYHDTYGAFPSGLEDDWSGPFPLLSWMGRLLPYIEQVPLWRQTEIAYRTDPFQTQNPPHLGMSALIPVYACPAVAVPLLATQEDGETIALSPYRGVNGTNLLAFDGVLYLNSAVRLTDITDGTSNTLLVGESLPLNAGADSRGAWYNGVGLTDGARVYGSPEVVLGVREVNIDSGYPGVFRNCQRQPYAFGPGTPGNPCDLFHFWSLHGGGANFLLADGSVRFLSYAADAVLPKLATRAGGEGTSAGDD